MTMSRQGDVLLVQNYDLPLGMDEVAPEPRGGRLEYVLAHGETTGDVHAISASGQVALRRHSDRGIVVVQGGGSAELKHELKHEEHRPLAVRPALTASSGNRPTMPVVMPGHMCGTNAATTRKH